jgi:hypothetical protein
VLSVLSKETLLIIDDPKRELGGRIATDIVTPKVVRDVLDWSKSIEKDIQNGKPPRVLTLYLMMNVARDYLASGRFHIYRGALSMQGQALKGINAYCLSELAKLGQMTTEERRAALQATNEDIAAMG